MGKKLRYASPVKFQIKAAEAKGWDGVAETIRVQLQENCDLMVRKHITPTKLVGFSLDVRREFTSKKDVWQGVMVLRFNNNLLAKNVLRYNFQNAFRWQFAGHASDHSYLDPEHKQRVRSWYVVYNRIKDRRYSGIYDFLNSKIVTVNVRFDSEKWPSMNYDELFDLIENSGARRSSFRTVWEDPEQRALDEFMLKEILN